MEESVVSFVVKRLGGSVIQEIKFVKDVSQQFQKLKRELSTINQFLETAHGMRFEDPSTRRWVAEVREIAYDVDDVLDSFLLKIESRKARGYIMRILKKPGEYIILKSIGRKIDTIFDEIEEIGVRQSNYIGRLKTMVTGGSSSPNFDEVSLRRTYAHVKDVDIVGLEEDTRTVVQLMTEQNVFRVFSICGMGGLGKSTLAKAVYNRVKSEFDFCAWLFISQQCQTKTILQDILYKVLRLNSPDPQWEKRDEKWLVEELSMALKQKRYLVVLDDVWSLEVWQMLKPAFPKGSRGSKVMITTRNKKVATGADPHHPPFEPQLLDEDNAWDLLCKKSFPSDAIGTAGPLTHDLEVCGKAMVKKCGGLPLAIKELGTILAAGTGLPHWEAVNDKFSFHIHKSKLLISVLGLSYIDLPFHLKPLFLYMGLFPGHCNVPVNVLIKMWFGESLVSIDDENQVTMGRQYLDELVERCLVQVCEKNLLEKVKTCKLHDIMRDVCVSKAMNENFLKILGKNVFPFDSSTSNFHLPDTKVRRCAIYVDQQRYEFQFKPCMRSAFYFVYKSPKVKYKDFKLVKVLDFNGVRFPDKRCEVEFFDVLVLLVNLRFLGLRNTDIEMLPSSIGSLVYLETLDARSISHKFIFPKDVVHKLIRLKHFYIYKHDLLERMHQLAGLRILSTIRADTWTEEMGRLVNLEKLGIIELKADNQDVVFSSVINKLENLRSLSLSMSDNIPFPHMGLAKKRHLQKLSLTGRIQDFSCIAWPSRIIKLQLLHSRVINDPLPILEGLHYLVHLSLNQTYRGETMVCSRNGFLRLQYLEIVDLQGLVVWEVDEGALQCLQTCVINSCPFLDGTPKHFRSITALQKLVVRDMPATFRARVQVGGEDWESVEGISSIIIE